ncbi:hypothetical protein B0H17DRAFT_1137914 [Mycena rosella]|uniref:Uncharacterized protein n=1 Tax=Mycena rosella TaxID=1033263 RepID=A0AAD7D7I1_MYCRO|nr:hypothetical protein B0H17DRAFT_1137914 [Mycena rosella]
MSENAPYFGKNAATIYIILPVVSSCGSTSPLETSTPRARLRSGVGRQLSRYCCDVNQANTGGTQLAPSEQAVREQKSTGTWDRAGRLVHHEGRTQYVKLGTDTANARSQSRAGGRRGSETGGSFERERATLALLVLYAVHATPSGTRVSCLFGGDSCGLPGFTGGDEVRTA